MSRKEYYHKGYISYVTKLISKFNLRVKDALSSMSMNSMKTADMNKFLVGVNAVSVSYIPLWNEFFGVKSRSRLNLFKDARKRSVLRTTIGQFQLPGEGPVDIAYGDGAVAATSKGELSVPTKYIKEMVGQLFTYNHDTDEYGTSSRCPDCGDQLYPVYTLRNGQVWSVRGLKFCNSKECKSCSLKHRENVGADNIFVSFVHEKYGVPLPPLLDRNHPIQKKKANVKKLRNQHHLIAPCTNIPKTSRKKQVKQTKAQKRVRRREREAAAAAAARTEVEGDGDE